MPNKYALLDRDGTLIFEPPDTFQIDSIDKLRILPGVVPGLKKLIEDGYKLIMVSNQDGLGTASFPQKDFDEAQNEMIRIFGEEGIEFAKILICPDLPESNCACRKPKTGLVDELDIGENSFVCGDRDSDRAFAKNLRLEFRTPEELFGRTSQVLRKTNETSIEVELNLDGVGEYTISTGIGFLDHMLELFSKHSLIDLKIKAQGDLVVDEHHITEDLGLVLGQALREALGDKKGIQRYGFLLPMDEALAEIVIDLGGRPYLVWNAEFKREKIGDLSTELFEDFFKAVSDSLGANIHVNLRYGRNEHHMAEAIFKGFAKALRAAVDKDPRAKNLLPSTKGKL